MKKARFQMEYSIPRHVFGGIAPLWTRAGCQRCEKDLVYQKGDAMLMDADGRHLCPDCAETIEDESGPTIWWRPDASPVTRLILSDLSKIDDFDYDPF